MTDHINKSYVKRYVDQAKATDNEDIKNNCLYRAGTQMEVIEVDSDNLTPEQRQTVLDASDKLLGR